MRNRRYKHGINVRFQLAKGVNVKKQFLFVILFLTTGLINLPTSAFGQWYGGGGYGGIGWGGAAGGVGEIYSGMGNLVRSEGQRNVLNAEAEKQYQQALQENEKARAMHLENQKNIHAEQLRRRREAKAMNAEDREAALAARERQQEFLDAHRPQPLDKSQFNPSTASIDWPPALRASDFSDLRNSIEMLFQSRSKYGANSDVTRQITKAVGELKDLLRSQILKIPGSDYSEARKFLDRLAVSVL